MADQKKYAADAGAGAGGDPENPAPRTSAPRDAERKQVKLRKPKLMREMSRNLSELEVTQLVTSFYYRRWCASVVVFGAAFVCVFFLLSWPQVKVYDGYEKAQCYIVGNTTDTGGPNQCSNSNDPTTCRTTFKCVLHANYRTDAADPRPPACPPAFTPPPTFGGSVQPSVGGAAGAPDATPPPAYSASNQSMSGVVVGDGSAAGKSFAFGHDA